MKVIKKIAVLIVVLVISYITAELFWRMYEKIFDIQNNSIFIGYDLVAKYIFGMVASYIFFLFCLFTIFGDNYKYWWVGILSIPAIIFEAYFDFAHIYFPITLGLIGWLLGWAINRAIASKSAK